MSDIFRSVDRRLFVGGRLVQSAGTTGFDVVDPATLMRAADAALYEAKERGRDRVVLAPARRPGTGSAGTRRR